MSEAELRTFEQYCETLYNSPSAEERSKAEAALVQLSTTPEYIPQCQFVLSSSQLPYAQLVACNALKKLLSTCWNHLTPVQRVDSRNYALNFLASSGPSCQNFVNASCVQLLACVTKLGWMDLEDPQQVIYEASRFLQVRGDEEEGTRGGGGGGGGGGAAAAGGAGVGGGAVGGASSADAAGGVAGGCPPLCCCLALAGWCCWLAGWFARCLLAGLLLAGCCLLLLLACLVFGCCWLLAARCFLAACRWPLPACDSLLVACRFLLAACCLLLAACCLLLAACRLAAESLAAWAAARTPPHTAATSRRFSVAHTRISCAVSPPRPHSTLPARFLLTLPARLHSPTGDTCASRSRCSNAAAARH